MDIKFEGNKLFLPASKIAFKYNIERIIQVKLGVIVLLDVPIDDEDNSNNIYTLDINGNKLWKVQHLREAFPKIQKFSPYVGMTLLDNGNISATNYFGMNYEISIKNGQILSSRMVK